MILHFAEVGCRSVPRSTWDVCGYVCGGVRRFTPECAVTLVMCVQLCIVCDNMRYCAEFTHRLALHNITAPLFSNAAALYGSTLLHSAVVSRGQQWSAVEVVNTVGISQRVKTASQRV